MTVETVGVSFLILGVFLLIGKAIRYKVSWISNLFLPSSIVGGFLALIVGPGVLGPLLNRFVSPDSFFANGLIPDSILEVWSALPSMFINIIFASIFLGNAVPSVKKIWKIASPQILMGHAVSWGQYVIGMLLTILVLTPFFGMNPLAGALIEITFVGGHGTAAGMANTFYDLGFPEGADLSLGLATIGVLTGVIVGIFLINYMQRKGQAKYVDAEATDQRREQIGESHGLDTEPEVIEAKAIEPLAFHFALIAAAIIGGYLILQALIFLETLIRGEDADMIFFSLVPSFPIAMIAGMLIQMIANKLGFANYIDRSIINKISGFALDILLVSSLATLSLDVIGNNLIPFVLLSLVAIIFNIIAVMFLAPRLIPDYWFERAMGDFGQATGMAATGILLMKIADPQGQTPAMEGFSYKQILFEPFCGGGLVTSASMPLILAFGPVAFLVISIVMFAIFLILGFANFKRLKQA